MKASPQATGTTVYDFDVRTADGTKASLKSYQDRVLLIVNVASRCGFTPQYAGLEALHRRYSDQGFAVLGFPCNQFGGQEPDGDAEIQTFCQQHFQVTFPVFAKIDVNGAHADPLFRRLTAESPGWFGTHRIKWNFTKFLIDHTGHVSQRFSPSVRPEKMEPAVIRAIKGNTEKG